MSRYHLPGAIVHLRVGDSHYLMECGLVNDHSARSKHREKVTCLRCRKWMAKNPEVKLGA